VSAQADVKTELSERRAFEIEGEPKEVTVPLITIRNGPNREVGIGLELSIYGRRPLHMLFDTGASGILISQSAVDPALLQSPIVAASEISSSGHVFFRLSKGKAAW
jgi:hypothetical protein